MQKRLLIALLLLVSLASAEIAKRLILKDGSYQLATKWEIKGDRVRYFSSERDDWEEIPNSLIDWQATERWEKERPEIHNLELERESAEERADREKEEADTPEVAPGIRLPAQGGVLALDTFKGRPQLSEITQNGSELNKHTGRNILRAAITPLPSSKQTLELKGAHADVQIHTSKPTLFLNIEQDPQTKFLSPNEHFKLVKVEQKKDTRVVGNIKISMTGKTSQQQHFLPTTAKKVSGDWIELVPSEALEPGEYALVEMLNEKEMNLYVWDFGVKKN